MNSGVRQSLLLVDADPQSLRVLDVSLKKAGYDVLTAKSGEEALAILGEHSIDLVISDTHMAQMDGFELCRRIKERQDWARIPFIFLSSRKTIEDKIRGLEIGVEDYLIKPVYIKEITTRVRMLLQRREREKLESRRDTRTRFAGELSDIGIVDLVQTIEVNRKSGIVHINNTDGRRGAIYFRDGRVIDAEAGRLAGHEAVYRLFAWNDGSFEVEFKSIRRRDVIDLSSQALLMEGMRRLDEWTRLLETLPPLETVFEVDYYVLAERLADIPDEVNTILRLLDGRRSLLQVIDDSDFPDLEAVSIVGRLHGDRVIYEAQGDKPAHAEPRQARMGRLERWLSESPWAHSDRTPPPVKSEVVEGGSEDRSTLTGFSTSHENAPSEPGPKSTTNQGMNAAPDEAMDPGRIPVGRTLHGFAPVRIRPSDRLSAADVATLEVTSISDLDKTPSPTSVGAQPSEEMQLSADADSTNDPSLGTATERPISDGASVKNSAEQITSQSSLDEATREALLHDPQGASNGLTASHAEGFGRKEIDDDYANDEDDQSQDDGSSSQVDDAATPEELASLAAILGGQADDPTPIGTLHPSLSRDDDGEAKRAKHQARPEGIAAFKSEPGELAARAESVSAADAGVGRTVLLEPSDSSDASTSSDGGRVTRGQALSEPPELRTRQSGSARKEGIVDPFEDQLPPSKWRQGLIILSVAMVVCGVVLWVAKRNTVSRRPHLARLTTGAEVQRLQPLPVVDLPAAPNIQPPVVAAAAVPSIEKPPVIAGPRTSADRRDPSNLESALNANAEPKAPAKQAVNELGLQTKKGSETSKSSQTSGGSADALAQAIDDCKKADSAEKYAPTMKACGRALELGPQDPKLMVMLAHAELDRGHSPAALRWAKKAVAADPRIADAYVFIGQVEQERGNKSAAKVAYLKYLELAGTGKFAGDLRVIVKKL